MSDTSPSVPPHLLPRLVSAASAAKATAYAPYSNFRVGAAMLCTTPDTAADSDPPIVTGANVENAAYPVGMCAERVLIGKVVTEGYWTRPGEEGGEGRRGSSSIRALAVATDTVPGARRAGCAGRRELREFCNLKMPVYLVDGKGDYTVKTLEELLPLSFGPENLKLERRSG
ncbi:cytidine deaminase-like protein [Kalaharituber pfeilii]|nr:cytidine deaminase-like protein [Kalaharituber pfeilii]